MRPQQDFLKDLTILMQQVLDGDRRIKCASIGYQSVGYVDLAIGYTQGDLFSFLRAFSLIGGKINKSDVIENYPIGTIWFDESGNYSELMWDESMQRYFWFYRFTPKIPANLQLKAAINYD